MILKNYNKKCLITKIVLAYGLLVLTGCGEGIPESYEGCDKVYEETKRVVTHRSTSDPRLTFSYFSGELSVKPGRTTTQSSNVYAEMSERSFYSNCSVEDDLYGRACPNFAYCVSRVKHSKEKSSEAFRILSFEEIIHVLRDDRLERGKLKPSVAIASKKIYKYSGRPLVSVKNIEDACVSSNEYWYHENLTGRIFRNVPEVKSWEDALQLEAKIYEMEGSWLPGKCGCVLSEFTGVREENSIGYCEGDRFIDY